MADGTKTVVKAQDEAFDPEKVWLWQLVKKALGNRGNYFNEFKKWMPEEEEKSLGIETDVLRTPIQAVFA